MPADHAEVVGARYELTRELARDSSFAVYEAEDHRLSAPAGIAWSLEPVGTGQRGRRSVGQRMARAAHPHIVSTYDRGLDRARPFVAFHRPPSDLASELALAPYPPGRVAQMGADLSLALETLQRHRVRPGALHPGHVGIDADGSARLSPWPLAPPPAGWGGEGAWSPPEALAGAASSATGDIWSLGAVLLSALIGTGPVQLSAADANELVDRLRATADPAILDAVGTSMSADPSRRFASGGGLAAALQRAPGVVTLPAAAAATSRWSRPGVLVARRATAFTSAAIVVTLSATAAGMGLNSLGGSSVALSCGAGHSASATTGSSCAPRSSGAGHDRTSTGGGRRGSGANGSAASFPTTPVGTSGAVTTARPASAAEVKSVGLPPSTAPSTAPSSATTAAPAPSGLNSGGVVGSAPVPVAPGAPSPSTAPVPSAQSSGSPSPNPDAGTGSGDGSSGHDSFSGRNSSSGHGPFSNGNQGAGTSPSSSSTSVPGTEPGPGSYPSPSSAGTAGYPGTGSSD